MASAERDFTELLRDQLEGLHRRFDQDELAFLALTSKVELPIRDRLAYALSRELPELLVAREWRRVDLAVLSQEVTPEPLLLLEAKALYSFDLVGNDAQIKRYPALVRRDFEKLRAIIDVPDAAALFGLVLVTHPTGSIPPGLWQVAKYSSGIAKAVKVLGDPAAVEQAAKASLESQLGELGPIHAGRIPAGQAYGVPLASCTGSSAQSITASLDRYQSLRPARRYPISADGDRLRSSTRRPARTVP